MNLFLSAIPFIQIMLIELLDGRLIYFKKESDEGTCGNFLQESDKKKGGFQIGHIE